MKRRKNTLETSEEDFQGNKPINKSDDSTDESSNDGSDGKEEVTYSRIVLPRSHGNLQSYWTTTKVWKLTVVFDYYEAMETYRIELLRSYENL